jgi:acetoin utilization deacetylase AcuC-like enzyme
VIYCDSGKAISECIIRTAILHSEKVQDHALTAERYESFTRLFRKKLRDNPDFEIIEPGYTTDNDLKLVHTEEHIRRVKRCESRAPHDTPQSLGVARAAKLIADAGKLAGKSVQSDRFSKAIGIGGIVQHAGKSYGKGSGIFSDGGSCQSKTGFILEVFCLLALFTAEELCIVPSKPVAVSIIHQQIELS